MPPQTVVVNALPSDSDVLAADSEKHKSEAEIENDLKHSYKTLWGRFETELKWNLILLLGALNINSIWVFITAPYLTHLGTISWCFLVGSMGGYGVTAGAHRYWCHRSYKAKLPLRIILLILYTIAGQNTLLEWVRDHRVHHKFSETEADPHNSKRGFFFAHIGWLMMRKNRTVIAKSNQLDFSDLFEDPVFRFQQKYFLPMKLLFSFILPMWIPYYFWNETVYWTIQATLTRYAVSLHITFLVNSVAHLYGTRPYDKNIGPVENPTVSYVTLGEGWHNYHHVFPWDYKAAELGKYSLNLTTLFLDMFAKIGWAYDLKVPSKELLKNYIENKGDGSHPEFDLKSNYKETKVY